MLKDSLKLLTKRVPELMAVGRRSLGEIKF